VKKKDHSRSIYFEKLRTSGTEFGRGSVPNDNWTGEFQNNTKEC